MLSHLSSPNDPTMLQSGVVGRTQEKAIKALFIPIMVNLLPLYCSVPWSHHTPLCSVYSGIKETWLNQQLQV